MDVCQWECECENCCSSGMVPFNPLNRLYFIRGSHSVNAYGCIVMFQIDTEQSTHNIETLKRTRVTGNSAVANGHKERKIKAAKMNERDEGGGKKVTALQNDENLFNCTNEYRCGVRQIVWYEFRIESMFDARTQKTTNNKYTLHLFTLTCVYKMTHHLPFDGIESSRSECVCVYASMFGPLFESFCNDHSKKKFAWLSNCATPQVGELTKCNNWKWKFILVLCFCLCEQDAKCIQFICWKHVQNFILSFTSKCDPFRTIDWR